ncbi:hypothetical protein [Streptomyces sp. SJL17-1]|uniref:hypothetical protein n=1 Tax=Streptomyces sp. SJL17-1 TaxID=2967223 RepID=UPI002966E297|nr:hypothetical protein [Streptomyces sp. SJL17-1]
MFDTHPNDKAFLSANAYYWVDSFARYLRGLGNTTLNAKMVPVDVDPQGVPTADKSEWIGTTNPPRMRFDMKLVPGAADLGIIVHEYTHGVVQWLRAGATTPLEYEHSICDVMAGVYRDLESLNESFRYQLTAIGAPAPDLHVSRRLTDHTFEIAGGAAGLDVCWQITGVRCDNWARANPLIADKSKSAEEKGLLVHPELIGRPADRRLSALVTPGVASSDAVHEDAADRTPP